MRLRSGHVLSSEPNNSIPLSLPAEIIYIVAELASLETRLVLVQCNKWLYKMCTPLLYEEIRLDTPEQLLMLYRDKNAMRNLKNTKTMFMDHFIFYSDEWEGIKRRFRPAIYIIRILQAATSLRRLQFIQSDDYDELVEATEALSRQFSSSLSNLNLISDQTFLPNLEILVDSPADCGLLKLCSSRALALVSRLEGQGVVVSFFPGLDPSSEFFPQETTAVPPNTLEQIASSRYLNLSAKQIGQLVHDIMGPLRPNITFLELNILSADAVMHQKPSPINDPLNFVLTAISTINCPKLDLLFFKFIPEPPYQTASAQYAALQKLLEIIPELEETTFSHPDITWCKRPFEGRYLPRPAHLANMDWIADPLQDCPEVLNWWLDILGLKASGSEEQLRQTATQLRQGMRSWWINTVAPSEEDLYTQLLALVR